MRPERPKKLWQLCLKFLRTGMKQVKLAIDGESCLTNGAGRLGRIQSGGRWCMQTLTRGLKSPDPDRSLRPYEIVVVFGTLIWRVGKPLQWIRS